MTQPASSVPYKQLRRPTTDRIVAGVASGLGRYFNIDPTLVRVGFAVLVVVTWGTALLAYPVMWFLMPEESAQAPAWPHPADAGPTWAGPAGTGQSWTGPSWSGHAEPAGSGPAATEPAGGVPAAGWRDPADPTWGQPPAEPGSAAPRQG